VRIDESEFFFRVGVLPHRKIGSLPPNLGAHIYRMEDCNEKVDLEFDLCWSLTAGTASAAHQRFWSGVVLGSPPVFQRASPRKHKFINMILGYDLNNHDNRYYRNDPCCRDHGVLYMGADYVWYNYNLIHVNVGRLPLYYGPA